MSISAIVETLRKSGLVQSISPTLHPLTGGVSSDIMRIDDGDRHFVVKRALAKLRVRDDWFADTSRNQVEENYLRTVGDILPGSVPRVVFSRPEEGWFAMEYLGAEFSNWKSELLQNRADSPHATHAGIILGTIHRETWASATMARKFDTLGNFRQLRLEPYLETTAVRVPDLAPLLRAEKARLAQTALALVHGDFSPKNILYAGDRMVVLDAEVGLFGDPVFYLAFLLTHFHLKALLHAASPDKLLGLVPAFWSAYSTTLGFYASADLEYRTTRLTLCLLLARIHGKSPVEYLTEKNQSQFVTEFVRHHLPHPPGRISDLTAAWQLGLCQQ